MTVLVLGLLIFLGIHSVRIFADDWRGAQVARFGINGWKLIHSLVSAPGLVLIVVGFGLARQHPVVVYLPPAWTRHVAALLTLVAFVLVAAAYVPRNHLKALVGHPMVAGVKSWAFAHLLANGRAADLVLFGSFLVWSMLDYRAARRRDRANATRYPAGTVTGDVLTGVVGVLAWALFAFVLHGWLIGVQPFPRG